jgi:hypothetical protein
MVSCSALTAFPDPVNPASAGEIPFVVFAKQPPGCQLPSTGPEIPACLRNLNNAFWLRVGSLYHSPEGLAIEVCRSDSVFRAAYGRTRGPATRATPSRKPAPIATFLPSAPAVRSGRSLALLLSTGAKVLLRISLLVPLTSQITTSDYAARAGTAPSDCVTQPA